MIEIVEEENIPRPEIPCTSCRNVPKIIISVRSIKPGIIRSLDLCQDCYDELKRKLEAAK